LFRELYYINNTLVQAPVALGVWPGVAKRFDRWRL